MASVVIAGDTSGTCTLQANAVAGTTTLTLPTTSGTLVATGGAPSFTTITTGLGNASAPSITFTGDTNTGIFSPTADTIAFTEGGAEAMRITSTGTVAIGTTTTPTAKLWVDSGRVGLSNTYKLGWHSNPAHGDLANYITGDDATNYIAIGAGNAERMRIDSSGNVGIGTSSPTAFGAGYTSLCVNASTAPIVDLFVGGTRTASFNGTSTYSQVSTITNTPLLLGTNNTERGRFDTSGNFLFNSGYGSVATAYGCRAWVNFTGSTGTINASGNVSSVTRNGTGDYSVNFTNAMPDANYAGTGMGRRNSAAQRPVLMCMSSSATYNQFTTYARFYTMLNDSATIEDPIWFNYTVFR